MQRTIASLVVLALLCAATSEVRAITTLEFEFLDSGQTFAPTDQVVMRGRVTNTGDTPLLNALASGGVNLFIHAPAIFSNYVETPGGFGFGPIGLFPLDPGESVDFTVATWSPWPIGGSAGDPVPLGDYEFPASAFIHITYTEFNPFIPYSVDFSNAGSFVWHVTTGDEVIPEPMTAGLALISVGALSMVVRRRRDRHPA